MSKPINTNVNLNTNHTTDANTNTNHTANANANANQHRRDVADEKEVQGSTIIDLEVDYEPPSHYFEPYGVVFSRDYSPPSSPSLTSFSKPPFSIYHGGFYESQYASSSQNLTPFSNGLFDLDLLSTNGSPQAQQRSPVASPQLNGLPRLIPPSEIQARGELTANMSVDIEGVFGGVAGGSPVASGSGGGVGHGNGGGSTSNSNSKGKNRNLKQQHHPEGPNASHPHEGDPDEFHYPSHDHQEQGLDPELLNSSESLQLRPPPTSRLLRPPTLRTTASPSSTENSNSNRRKFDWVKAEKNWDTSVPLTRMEQVWEGDCWVGWKAPAINPRSLTSGILFSVAQISPASSIDNMNRISYRVMQRPERGDAARAFGIGRRTRSMASAGGSGLGSSFGAFGGSGFGGYAGTRLGKTRKGDGGHPEEDLLGDEETIALKEAVEAGWRVLVV